jgi:hypothetical protein
VLKAWSLERRAAQLVVGPAEEEVSLAAQPLVTAAAPGSSCAARMRHRVARLAYQGAVTVMALLPPLLRTPVSGMDFKPGHQIQADHEQIRHHDTSDDEHAAAGSEYRCRMADRGWRAKPTRRGVSGVGVVAAGLGSLSCGEHKLAAEIRFVFACLQCRAFRPEAR